MDKTTDTITWQSNKGRSPTGPMQEPEARRDQTKLDSLFDSLYAQQDETHRLIDQLTDKLLPFLYGGENTVKGASGIAPTHGVPLLDQLQQRIDAQRELNERLAELTHRITD